MTFAEMITRPLVHHGEGPVWVARTNHCTGSTCLSVTWFNWMRRVRSPGITSAR